MMCYTKRDVYTVIQDSYEYLHLSHTAVPGRLRHSMKQPGHILRAGELGSKVAIG